MPSTKLRVELLGGFQVSASGRGVADDVGPCRKPAALSKRLAVTPRHRYRRRAHGTGLERLTADDDGSAPLGRALHLHSAAVAGCPSGESPLRQARRDGPDGCPARTCGPHASLGSRSVGRPWVRRAELAAWRGAYDEARTCSREASRIATAPVVAGHVRDRAHATAAFAAVEQGDPEQVVRPRHSAVTSAARYGDRLTCSALMNPVAAEAFASLDDADGAHAFANAAFAAQPYGAKRSSRLASATPA